VSSARSGKHVQMKPLLRSVLALIVATAAIRPASADDPEHVARVREAVAFDQKLGARVDPRAVFLDEEGTRVTLGDYLGKKPVVLTPVYFGCPQLCTQVLNGLVRALAQMNLEPGRDFEIVTFSIDPSETPALARQKKASYLELLGRPAAASGWHFLCAAPAATADATTDTATPARARHDAAIDALTATIGFRYAYDEKIDQYAHAAGIVVLTPEGVVSKYLYGIEFLPRDLRLALVDSSNGKVGTVADQLFLWICYHYDPLTGKYSFAVMSVLRACGALTAVALVGWLAFNLRRERNALHPRTGS
jgi:protein SCO1/2